MTGRHAKEGTRREWLRYHLAYKLTWPLWMLIRLEPWARRMNDRIINWGERV